MFPTKQGTGGLRVPLVSFTGRDPRGGVDSPSCPAAVEARKNLFPTLPGATLNRPRREGVHPLGVHRRILRGEHRHRRGRRLLEKN